jgi:hypothetical protein
MMKIEHKTDHTDKVSVTSLNKTYKFKQTININKPPELVELLFNLNEEEKLKLLPTHSMKTSTKVYNDTITFPYKIKNILIAILGTVIKMLKLQNKFKL